MKQKDIELDQIEEDKIYINLDSLIINDQTIYFLNGITFSKKIKYFPYIIPSRLIDE